MKLRQLTQLLENLAPLSYQESYDNAGLLTGHPEAEVSGVLISLDCTEEIVDEAIRSGCNVIVSHHPVVFKGLKKLTGANYVERTLLKAIKADIALYAIHTNLDSVHHGVNKRICDRLGLTGTKVLQPKGGILRKLVVYCPTDHAAQVRSALFSAGAGNIGNYSECSFNAEGTGTFKGDASTSPFAGEPGVAHQERELRIETVYPKHLERKILLALFESHPYEEVAYDIFQLENPHQEVGSGMVGWLEEGLSGEAFLHLVKEQMDAKMIRHTKILPRLVRKVAVCGGSGSFLLPAAVATGADVFLTADFKYHEFFDADGKLIIADIGHFESEQFTSDLLKEEISKAFPELTVRKTSQSTNPVNYFF